MFGRFDAIEETLVDDGLASGGDGSEQGGGTRRVRAGHGRAPLPQPMLADGGDGIARDALEECGLVQQGMADAAVAPVEQGEGAAVAAEITGMEIAMDERVGEAAGCQLDKAARQTAQELVERGAVVGEKAVGRPLDHVRDRGAEGRGTARVSRIVIS